MGTVIAFGADVSIAPQPSLQQFTSESYAEGHRFVAWQKVLGALDLRLVHRPTPHMSHATALMRGAADRVLVARLVAGAQTLFPDAGRPDMPILLLLEEHGAVLQVDGRSVETPAGALLVLPRHGSWRLVFPDGLRATALSIRALMFRGRRTIPRDEEHPRALPHLGITAILAGMMRNVGDNLEHMAESDWPPVEASLVDLFLSAAHAHRGKPGEAGSRTSQTALLDRVCQTIERRFHDPGLTPARVAESEGISERYLQKLFEGTGENFSLYLRERRLQRAAADLASPAEASLSVSEIAFRCGFSDAAHFSRAFRDRFGMTPRDFRQGEAERLRATTGSPGQRGWPQDAMPSGRKPRTPAEPISLADRGTGTPRSEPNHHHLPVDASRIHWGYFSRALSPQLEVASGDTITVETLTQHASDDPARMIVGDPGAESVFRWTADAKGVVRRGAGPMDGSIYGRGAGEGFGVHICTGPIAVREAQPGDVLEVRVLDIVPRPSRHPAFAGRVFGSSVAAWWGFHYGELLIEPKPREIVTIYEIDAAAPEPHARALYSYRWTPQTDPFGTVHRTYDYPGVPVAPESVTLRADVLRDIRIPLRLHFGVIAVAPKEAELIDSVPPAYFGGNLDNWRLGKGAAVYLPVSVPGALLSVGDPHAAQGDGELAGTAIECSMTGTFAVRLHKKGDIKTGLLSDLTYPLIETETDWVLTGFSHPNYLAEFGAKGRSEVYAKSSLDLAMKDAFRKARRFLMNARGLDEDEAIALLSAAVDFGVTQVVDGNWGVHAVISKRLFA